MSETRNTHRRSAVVATAVLVSGIAASLAGNLQAINLDNARPGVGAYVSAVIWPLYLFGVVELLLHVPWLATWRDRLTKGAVLLAVAAVAAWVSYWHLANVLSHYGYDVASRYAGPVAVDAAMVLAALALDRVIQARRADAPAVSRPIVQVAQDTPGSVASQADADLSADIMANPMSYLPPRDTSLDTSDTLLDAPDAQDMSSQDIWASLHAHLDTQDTPTLPVPVSPAPTGHAPLEAVPVEAADLIRTWLSADAQDRPSPGDVDKLVGGAMSRHPRTARRWRLAMTPA